MGVCGGGSAIGVTKSGSEEAAHQQFSALCMARHPLSPISLPTSLRGKWRFLHPLKERHLFVERQE